MGTCNPNKAFTSEFARMTLAQQQREFDRREAYERSIVSGSQNTFIGQGALGYGFLNLLGGSGKAIPQRSEEVKTIDDLRYKLNDWISYKRSRVNLREKLSKWLTREKTERIFAV